ncbi:MAG TPA: response regulator [Verrucomicrobiae bacterium]|nr:response regulator [Verrucomicrobiae bacterium]
MWNNTDLKRPEAPVSILLVEDDPGHALLIEKNLRRAGLINDIITLGDGGEALEFLFRTGEDPLRPPPLLILLDVNLPVVDGCEVLRRIKEDERTRSIPVVMLTTTDSPQEISRCYELGCNIYIVKPVDYDSFTQAVRSLGLFLSIVAIPAGGKDPKP